MTGHGGYARRNELPVIPLESWRSDAECDYGRDPVTFEPLWDDRIEGETEAQRRARHDRAKTICNNYCNVRDECAEGIDWRTDEGIRGGHKLPPLDQSRTPAEDETLRLLKKGYTLDQAARWARLHVKEDIA